MDSIQQKLGVSRAFESSGCLESCSDMADVALDDVRGCGDVEVFVFSVGIRLWQCSHECSEGILLAISLYGPHTEGDTLKVLPSELFLFIGLCVEQELGILVDIPLPHVLSHPSRRHAESHFEVSKQMDMTPLVNTDVKVPKRGVDTGSSIAHNGLWGVPHRFQGMQHGSVAVGAFAAPSKVPMDEANGSINGEVLTVLHSRDEDDHGVNDHDARGGVKIFW